MSLKLLCRTHIAMALVLSGMTATVRGQDDPFTSASRRRSSDAGISRSRAQTATIRLGWKFGTPDIARSSVRSWAAWAAPAYFPSRVRERQRTVFGAPAVGKADGRPACRGPARARHPARRDDRRKGSPRELGSTPGPLAQENQFAELSRSGRASSTDGTYPAGGRGTKPPGTAGSSGTACL